MPFVIVGFVAYCLTAMYIDQDIAEPLRRRVASALARWGWKAAPTAENPYDLKPRRFAGLGRFLYQVQDCPYCLSTHVAFWATWYALGVHPWHKVFWLTWLAATGVAWLVVAVQVFAQEMIELLGKQQQQKGKQDANG